MKEKLFIQCILSLSRRTERGLPSSLLCTISTSGRLESNCCRLHVQLFPLMSVHRVSLLTEDLQPWYASGRMKRLSSVVYPYVSRPGRKFLKGRGVNSDVRIQNNGGSDKQHMFDCSHTLSYRGWGWHIICFEFSESGALFLTKPYLSFLFLTLTSFVKSSCNAWGE